MCILLICVGMKDVEALLDAALDEEFFNTPTKWPPIIAKDKGLRPLLTTINMILTTINEEEDKDGVLISFFGG